MVRRTLRVEGVYGMFDVARRWIYIECTKNIYESPGAMWRCHAPPKQTPELTLKYSIGIDASVKTIGYPGIVCEQIQCRGQFDNLISINKALICWRSPANPWWSSGYDFRLSVEQLQARETRVRFPVREISFSFFFFFVYSTLICFSIIICPQICSAVRAGCSWAWVSTF